MRISQIPKSQEFIHDKASKKNSISQQSFYQLFQQSLFKTEKSAVRPQQAFKLRRVILEADSLPFHAEARLLQSPLLFPG